MADKKVEIEYIAKDKTKAATKSVEKNMLSLGNVAKTVGPLVTASFGIAVIKSSVQAFIRQEAAIAQLEQRIKSTGGAAGFTSEELQRMASGLQAVTTFGDEATIEMQSLLLTFTQIQGPIFARAQESILNVAQAMGTDLKSAALQVGKALNDPAGQLSALSRSGIQFNDTQKEMIKTMQASGDIAGAQAVILKELETQFGGAARAARDTFGGSLTAAGNSIGDLSEKFGESIIEATGFKQVLQDIPGIINRIDRAINGIDSQGRLLEIDTEINALERDISGLNNLPMLPNIRASRIDERTESIRLLREEAEKLRGEISTPVDSSARAQVEANQVALDLIAEQERGAFDLRIALAQAEADEKNMIEEGHQQARMNRLMEMKQAELDTEMAIQSMKQTTANLSVNLLNVLGQKSKAFALIALGVQKGLDISKVVSAGLVAETTALSLGPGAPAAIATIKAITATNVALIAGLGIAQGASIAGGGGGGSAASVTGGSPIQQPQATDRGDTASTTVIFEGDFYGDEALVENKLIPLINGASQRGVEIVVRA
jgi:hypothetical protein